MALCLAVDVSVLLEEDGALRLPALQMIGGILRLRKELSVPDPSPRFDLVPVLFPDQATNGLDDLAALTGLDWTPVKLAEGDMVGRQVCGGNADKILFLTRESHHRVSPEGRRWLLGDPLSQPNDYAEVIQFLQDALRVPIARPIDPARRTGGLTAFPTDQAPDLRMLAFRDGSADWITVGDTLVVYTEDTDQDDRLAGLIGAQRLSYGENRHRVFIGPDVPATANGLIQSGQNHLFSLPQGAAIPADAISWIALSGLSGDFTPNSFKR